MNMSQHPLSDVPALPVGYNDLAVLRGVIRGYLATIRRSSVPSQERQRQIVLLEGVYNRLAAVSRNAAVLYLPLSLPEIYALNSAMLGFAAFVWEKVPSSRERDETLQTLEELRRDLLGVLTPQARP